MRTGRAAGGGRRAATMRGDASGERGAASGEPRAASREPILPSVHARASAGPAVATTDARPLSPGTAKGPVHADRALSRAWCGC
ncbi:hypothetical protein ACFSM7_11975 [Clavibacter michiganensis subsp. tessellarius]|uniref:hypothetical protein n=1 Tax=Clavibacter tessellarius TaxID=31965 RepID=UPI00363E7C59